MPKPLHWLGHLLLLSCLLGSPAWAAEHEGIIEARQIIDIRSPVEGLIESVTVDRGDPIKKGQVLVTLESGVERANLEIARFRTEVKGPVVSAEARVEFARHKEERQAELAREHFVSPSALEEARTERRLAEAELAIAKENQRQALLEVTRAEEQLRMRVIRSPVDGVVVERLLKPGELTNSNTKEPILKLAEIDPLNVEVVLPASLYGHVRRGDLAEVMPETPVGRYSAKVVVVDRVIDAASGTFGVRLELRNPNHAIPAGAKCRVRFLR